MHLLGKAGFMLPAVGIVLLVGLTYHQVLSSQFTGYDDTGLITDRLTWLKSPQAFGEAFKQDAFMDGSARMFYRPLLVWTFITDTQIFGSSAWGYHLTNLILHSVACWLVYLVFRQAKITSGWAFGGAALIAVHPILAQAVAWIPGRNDILLTIFFLASYLSLRLFINTGRWRWLVAQFVGFILALLTKETAILFPVIGGLVLFQSQKLKMQSYLLVFGGWLAAILVWWRLRQMAGIINGDTSAFLTRLFHNIPGFATYLGKLVWPLCLNGIPVLPDSHLTMWVGIGLTGLLIVWFYLIRGWRRQRVWLGIGWFLILLAPAVLPVVDSDQYHYFLEHRIYLPLVGLLLALLSWLPEAFHTQTWLKPKVIRLGGLGLMGVMVWLTMRQTDTFTDPVVFWEHSVTCSPHAAIAWSNLGTIYLRSGEHLDRAEADIQHAITLYPLLPNAHANLAGVYFTTERYKDAEAAMQLELQHTITVKNLFVMGAIEERLGYLQDAAHWWQRALTLDPQDWQANMAMVQYWYYNDNLKAAYPYYVVAHEQHIQFTDVIEQAMQKLKQ